MPTKRVPQQSKAKVKITPRAVEIFSLMVALPECACEVGPEYWQVKECDSCAERTDLHAALYRELRLAPWQWPAIRRGRDGRMPGLWLELEKAAGEQENDRP